MSVPPDAGGAAEAARWAAVQALFVRAVALEGAARAECLDAGAPDDGVRREVEALLDAHDRRGRLDALADDVIAPLLAPRTAAPAAPAVPSLPTNARYRIVERLGGGGMGVVYRARDERLERDVALKFLPPHLHTDEDAKRRFLVEARAAAALEHPNICTVHEIGDTDDGQLYIVMACYDGETLDRRIARGPLPVAEAVRVAADIARGLGKAHERGIVHRDIKPANVVLTADGVVKILDFGIAKLSNVTATRTTGGIGTVAYMSPEQAFGEMVDHRTDIWSIGVVLYEMLAGQRPFRGPTDQATLVAALTAECEPVTTHRAEVPPALDAIVRRALAKRPEDRFANAGELVAALAAATAGPGAAPAPGSAPVPEPRDGALARGGERRQVTVVHCLLAGADRLVERLDPEDADRVTARVRDAAAEIAALHVGIVNHFAADAFVLLFGMPVAHEDDGVRGVQAAMAVHERVAAIGERLDARLGAPLRLRTGVQVGPVVAQRLRDGDRRFRITSAAADVAARLAAAASDDAILLAPEVRRMVAPFVHVAEADAVTLHPGAAPVVPVRVLGRSDARSRLEGVADAALTPFVGRARERQVLAEHHASARAGTGGVTVLVGEAGAGKSRLLHELRTSAGAAGTRILVGRCDAHGGTTPFLPFVEAAHEALGLARSGAVGVRHEAAVAAARAIDPSLEEFLPLLLALLGIPSEAHPVPSHLRGEVFQVAMLEAIAALFTLGARTEPTLLLLEDWHWADEGSRAALRQLAEIAAAWPLLLVVTARPDATIDWGSGDQQTVLHLAPLDGAAVAGIASAVLGASRVAPDLVQRLHERTGGNPFFVEELCEALREEGTIAVRDGVAVLAVADGTVHVPETVQGVLRTRIDRVDGEARDVLRVASVIGRDFARGVLEEVVEAGTESSRALDRLKAAGLVQQVGVVPEPVYRFKHALTQEVAYDSLLEHQRASLHEAVGRAIERRYAGRLDEQVERLAHHYGRAEAWADAVRWGLQSVDRAMGLSQNADALATVERVEEQVRRLPDDAARRDLHVDVLLRMERLCESVGQRTRQLAIADQLIALLLPHGPSARLAQAYQRQGEAFTLLRRFAEADAALARAYEVAEALGDGAAARSALRSLAFLRSYEGRHDDALEAIDLVLELGREAGDLRAEHGDLASKANMLRAHGRFEEALAILLSALERTTAHENPVRYGALLNVIGTVHRDLGNYDEALRYFQQTRGLLHHPVYASFTLPGIAYMQLEQGRVEEALATYREAVELNRKSRYADGTANACRSLGEVLAGLGRHAEAVPYLRDAAALFKQLQDRQNEALMYRRLADAQERLGEHGAARDTWAQLKALLRGDDCGEALLAAVEGIARAERRLGAPVPIVVAAHHEALDVARTLGLQERELALRNTLGIVHFERGAYAEALGHYDEALRLCREFEDRVHEGLILNSLGAVRQRLGDWAAAHALLLESVDVTTRTGEDQLRGHALGMLAESALVLGRPDEARDHADASLAIRRRLGDSRGEGWMLERLGRALHALGADGAARSALGDAAAIAESLPDPALRDAVARTLGTGAPVA